MWEMSYARSVKENIIRNPAPHDHFWRNTVSSFALSHLCLENTAMVFFAHTIHYWCFWICWLFFFFLGLLSKILLVLLWRNTISSFPCESPSLARLRRLDPAVHPRLWAPSQAMLGGSRCSPPWWRPKPGKRMGARTGEMVLYWTTWFLLLRITLEAKMPVLGYRYMGVFLCIFLLQF